jgi:hypothetical protein
MSSTEYTDQDFAGLASEMEKDEQAGKFQSKFWSPKNEGTTPVRIISPLKEFNETKFYMKYRQHYVGGHPYLCLNQTLVDKDGKVHEAEDCPICKKVKQLYNLSNNNRESEEAKLASSINAKDRYVCRVVIRGKKGKDGADEEAKPEFYEFGKKIFEMLFNAIKLGECGNFLSLKTGRDLNLSKKGTGRSTDYSGTALSMKQTPVFTDSEKIKQLITELPKMDYKQLVEFHSADELSKALDEYINGGNGEETTSDETPAVKAAPAEVKSDEKTSDANADDIDALLGSI